MKRIDIRYGGAAYSIGNRELADVMAEIDDGLASGTPFWLEVNDGEGMPKSTRLLLSAGTPIAVSAIPDESFA